MRLPEGRERTASGFSRESTMNVWNLLGYVWLMTCFVMGVFSMDGGFSRLLLWTIFGGGIWGLHSNMVIVRSMLPVTLKYMDKLLLVGSILLLLMLMARIFRKGLKAEED